MFRRASDLAEDAEFMRPRAVLVPPCIPAGMIVLLTMLAKGGKSTTLAGLIRDASQEGIVCALLSLDEALQDTVQRLRRFGADLDYVFIATEWDQELLEAELVALGVQFLGIDHLGKLAERDPAFGANSQGDALLWGRLISPFAQLARARNIGVALLDQSRRSDGSFSGSNAKAATVDILAELKEKDGGLECAPKGRFPLAAFRVQLDATGAPLFCTAGVSDTPPIGQGVVSAKVVATCFRTLQDAGEEGLTSGAWRTLCCEVGILKSTWNRARGALSTAGHITYASRIYRTSPSGDRAFRTFVPVEPIGASGTSGTFLINGSTQFPTLKGGTGGSIGAVALAEVCERAESLI